MTNLEKLYAKNGITETKKQSNTEERLVNIEETLEILLSGEVAGDE